MTIRTVQNMALLRDRLAAILPQASTPTTFSAEELEYIRECLNRTDCSAEDRLGYEHFSADVLLEVGSAMYTDAFQNVAERYELGMLVYNRRRVFARVVEYAGDEQLLLNLMLDFEDRLALQMGYAPAEAFRLMELPHARWVTALRQAAMGCQGHGISFDDDYACYSEAFEKKFGLAVSWPSHLDFAEFDVLADDAVHAHLLEPLGLCPGCIDKRIEQRTLRGVRAWRDYAVRSQPGLEDYLRVSACDVCKRFHDDLEAAQSCLDDARWVDVPTVGTVVVALSRTAKRTVVESFDDVPMEIAACV